MSTRRRFSFVTIIPWWLLLILSPFIALFFALWLMVVILYGLGRVAVFVMELAVDQVSDAIEAAEKRRNNQR